MARKKQFDYFGSLDQLASNGYEAAVILHDLLHDYSPARLTTEAERIHALEREGDQLVQAIVNELYDAFITPIDREDIVQIMDKLDDILDGLNATTYLLENLVITSIREGIEHFAQLIVEATAGVKTATKEFSKFKSSKTLKKMIEEVNSIEAQADKLYSQLTKDLFTNEEDPVEIIKWKDILDQLEDIIDDSEDAVDSIDSLVIKNT